MPQFMSHKTVTFEKNKIKPENVTLANVAKTHTTFPGLLAGTRRTSLGVRKSNQDRASSVFW